MRCPVMARPREDGMYRQWAKKCVIRVEPRGNGRFAELNAGKVRRDLYAEELLASRIFSALRWMPEAELKRVRPMVKPGVSRRRVPTRLK